MFLFLTTGSNNDPLEQFLTINLYPGCPVNNWDSSWPVMIIASLFLLYIFAIHKLDTEGLFRNYLLSIKIQYVNKKNSVFSFVFLNYNLFKLLIKNKIPLLKKENKKLLTTEGIYINKLWIVIKNYVILGNNFLAFCNLINLFISNTIKFISGIIKENLFIKKYPFFSIYYFSFMMILFFNILGLLPHSITATSSFMFILNYSFAILVGLNLLGAYIHTTKYFNQFLPEGVPLFIAPVLALIELFSNVIRIFSLTVRLFANILAGHSLLKIIIGVSWLLISIFLFYLPITFIIWLLLTPIFLLECVIAFLQAYVYVLLLVIYTNDVINIH